jgi:hypothetical protein
MKKSIKITESQLHRVIKNIINEESTSYVAQPTTNVVKLVKDIISFIVSMNIVPGPIDGGKILFNIAVKGENPVDVIKNFVNGKIRNPGENWKRIERDLENIKKSDITLNNFKNEIKNELTSLIGK